MKKIIGIALIIALVFGGVAATASAAKSDGGVTLYINDPGTGGI